MVTLLRVEPCPLIVSHAARIPDAGPAGAIAGTPDAVPEIPGRQGINVVAGRRRHVGAVDLLESGNVEGSKALHGPPIGLLGVPEAVMTPIGRHDSEREPGSSQAGQDRQHSLRQENAIMSLLQAECRAKQVQHHRVAHAAFMRTPPRPRSRRCSDTATTGLRQSPGGETFLRRIRACPDLAPPVSVRHVERPRRRD